jgi:hypothetical protein
MLDASLCLTKLPPAPLPKISPLAVVNQKRVGLWYSTAVIVLVVPDGTELQLVAPAPAGNARASSALTRTDTRIAFDIGTLLERCWRLPAQPTLLRENSPAISV